MAGSGSQKIKIKIKNSKVSLRAAAKGDCDLIFEWRNFPKNVRLSSSRQKVSQAEHQRWFDSVIIDRKKPMFLIEEKRAPVGLIRFEINNLSEAEISLYLIPEKIGKGIGVCAILKGCELLSEFQNVTRFVAKIRTNNLRSIRAFSKCGFRISSENANIKGHVMMALDKQ